MQNQASLQETKQHGAVRFPFNLYPCTIPGDFQQVALHWHESMELVFVKQGTGLVQVGAVTYPAYRGDIFLFAPGTLHALRQAEGERMEYENIIFHPNMLISKKTDTCNTDYLVPLLSGNVSLPLLYTPDSPHYAEISACIDANDEICKTYPSGYQLFIKGQLFLLFYTLFHKCSTKELSGKDRSKSLEKMKLILKYVENNYMEKITIEDIANEVDLSQSHFMKYFKNTMGTSFVDYLNEYRLTMASRLLISSDSSILAIASEVGFENLSYFNRIFKKRFGQTPREYRRRQSPA